MNVGASRTGRMPLTIPLQLSYWQTDPVCGTCRRKSRKCDRTRPQCRRCLSKGLVCEGYEAKFKFYRFDPALKQKQPVAAATAPTAAAGARVREPDTANTAPEPMAVDSSPTFDTFIPEIALDHLSFDAFDVPDSTHITGSTTESLQSPVTTDESDALRLARGGVISKADAQTLLTHCDDSNLQTL